MQFASKGRTKYCVKKENTAVLERRWAVWAAETTPDNQVRSILKTSKLSRVQIERLKRQIKLLHVDSVECETGKLDRRGQTRKFWHSLMIMYCFRSSQWLCWGHSCKWECEWYNKTAKTVTEKPQKWSNSIIAICECIPTETWNRRSHQSNVQYCFKWYKWF